MGERRPTRARLTPPMIIFRRVPEFAESPLVARVPNDKIQDYPHNHE
jgi:hypothetical protein